MCSSAREAHGRERAGGMSTQPRAGWGGGRGFQGRLMGLEGHPREARQLWGVCFCRQASAAAWRALPGGFIAASLPELLPSLSRGELPAGSFLHLLNRK